MTPMTAAAWSTLLAIAIPSIAHASFNAAPCSTFECHFLTIGALMGALGGLPVSGLIFIGLHLVFAHRDRSRIKQAILGGFVGLLAFEIAAAVGAYHAVWRHPPGYRGGSPWEAFLLTYAVLAVVSVLYARSAPGRALREH